MTVALTIVKGAFTVTIDASDVVDDYNKKLIAIRPAQTKQKHSLGPKATKIVDLLWVTHTMAVRGVIAPTSAKTAKEIKDDLISIIKGGDVFGTHCTVTYAGDTFNMFIEKCTMTEKASDFTPSSDAVEKSSFAGVGKYDVLITLVEGTMQ